MDNLRSVGVCLYACVSDETLTRIISDDLFKKKKGGGGLNWRRTIGPRVAKFSVPESLIECPEILPRLRTGDSNYHRQLMPKRYMHNPRVQTIAGLLLDNKCKR